MTAAATIASAVQQARADLDELRDRVADLAAERESIAAEPCDRAEAERRVGGFVAGAKARGRDLLDRPELLGGETRQISASFLEAVAREPLAVLAAVVPDQLTEAMLAGHPGGGLSSDARTARLAEFDRQLLAAEVAEELACREIENATGAMLPRRLDADPAILLAPDAELEPEFETAPAEAGSTKRRK